MCTNVRLYFLVRILRGCLFPVAVYECASWNILQSLKKNHIVTLTHLLLKVLLSQSHYSNFFFSVFTKCCLHRKICCHDKLDHFFKFLSGSVELIIQGHLGWTSISSLVHDYSNCIVSQLKNPFPHL